MSRTFALRLLETLFRRWVVCLLPLLLFGAFGVFSAATQKGLYRSDSVMYVENQTLLSTLTGAGTTPASSFQTPAQSANDRLMSLLGTTGFVRSVAERANLKDLIASGALSLNDVRASISAGPDSNNTLRVRATSEDPTVAYNLASASVESFIQWIIDQSLSESATAEQFLQSLADSYQTVLLAAQKALATYIGAHPDPANGTRPLAETIDINTLTGAVTTAQTKYTETVNKVENARLASAQTRSDVAGRLRVVDAPEMPTHTSSSPMTKVTQFLVFAMLGAMLSALLILIGTVTDSSFRGTYDVRTMLGVPVLATVPEARRSAGRLAGREVNRAFHPTAIAAVALGDIKHGGPPPEADDRTKPEESSGSMQSERDFDRSGGKT